MVANARFEVSGPSAQSIGLTCALMIGASQKDMLGCRNANRASAARCAVHEETALFEDPLSFVWVRLLTTFGKSLSEMIDRKKWRNMSINLGKSQ